MPAANEFTPETPANDAAVHPPGHKNRRKSQQSRWMQKLRLARIQCGRWLHSVALSLRRWRTASTPGKGQLAIIRNAVQHAACFLRGHRKLSLITGCLLLTAIILSWRNRPKTAVEPPQEKRSVAWEKVKIYPPQEGSAASSNGADAEQRRPEPGRFPSSDAAFTSGPAFPASDASTPKPGTPRAVWLLGTIEEIDAAGPSVRSAAHRSPAQRASHDRR